MTHKENGVHRQTIYRVASRHKPYSQLGNAMIRDMRLSLEARAVLTFILSHPPDWMFNMAWLVKNAPVGRDRAYRIMKELIKYGYCMRVQLRHGNGTRGRSEYMFTDEPGTIEEPLTEIQDTAEPDTADAATTKIVSHKQTKIQTSSKPGIVEKNPSEADDSLGQDLPFNAATHPLLKKAERFGVDPQPIIRKFARQCRRRKIDDGNAYLAKMVAEAIAKQHRISEEQALQWFSLPEPIAAHLRHIASTALLPMPRNNCSSVATEPRLLSARPAASSSLASSRLVSGGKK